MPQFVADTHKNDDKNEIKRIDTTFLSVWSGNI